MELSEGNKRGPASQWEAGGPCALMTRWRVCWPSLPHHLEDFEALPCNLLTPGFKPLDGNGRPPGGAAGLQLSNSGVALQCQLLPGLF